jgi:hypothetical protein
MLNRTNRTLSANLNGLNLGTRSAALVGANMDKNTLRIRHAHPDQGVVAVRDPMMMSVRQPMIMGYLPSQISGSSSITSRLTSSFERVRVFAEAPPAEYAVVKDDRACQTDRARGQSLPKQPQQSPKPPSSMQAVGQGWRAAWQATAAEPAIARKTLAHGAACLPRVASGG